MQWEDEAADQMFVEITIERAPQATRELFTDRVRKAVSLQHYNLVSEIDGDESKLDVVTGGATMASENRFAENG